MFILEPSNEVIEIYILQLKNPIIIKSLISKVPTQIVKNIPVPTIEKILVDLYCNRNLFSLIKGNELHTIFQNIFSKYTVNQSKLLLYRSRSGKKNGFIDYLKQIQNIGNR